MPAVVLVLVECEGEALVLDLGQGALGSLFQHRDPSSVTALVVSHMHADHHVNLVPLRNLLVYGYDERRRVRLHLPGGLRARYDAFLGEDGFLDDLPGADLDAGAQTVGPFLLQAHPVRHSLNSFAFRVSGAADPAGPGIVYSGDCGYAEETCCPRPTGRRCSAKRSRRRASRSFRMHLTGRPGG